LPSAEEAREAALHLQLGPSGPERRPNAFWNAVFDKNIVSTKRQLREPRRFERRLNVHVVIGHVRDELGVGLRLVPASHDAECDAYVAAAGTG